MVAKCRVQSPAHGGSDPSSESFECNTDSEPVDVEFSSLGAAVAKVAAAALLVRYLAWPLHLGLLGPQLNLTSLGL
jgi:hypothetical protein